jgi:S1-C subfamily serine protease
MKKSANRNFRQVVQRATVEFPETGGRGVLVGGNLILTSAHCIGYETDGTLALDDHLIREIHTHAGQHLQVQILVIDLVSDLAVLGSPDKKEFNKQSADFNDYCRAITPVPVCFEDRQRFTVFPVEIWTHNKVWVPGKGSLDDRNTRRITIQSGINIRGGTCGSAIVNEIGELIAVVASSNSDGNASGQECVGLNPFFPNALPVWVVKKIRGGLR